MKMNRMTAVACAALALVAAPVGAAQPNHYIAIVNDYAAPMVVLFEDAAGALHEVARLSPGEVRMVETTVDGTDVAPVRLHARATNSKDRWSTWGDVEITSDVLAWANDDTAVFWIGRNLAESSVEIRAH